MRSEQCDIVQDLLVLYDDDSCSEASKKMIQEHIKDCKECSNTYKLLEKQVPSIKEKKEIENGKETIKGIERRITFRNVIAIAITIGIILGLYILLNQTYRRVELTKDDIAHIYELENGDVYVEVKANKGDALYTFYDPNSSAANNKKIEPNIICEETLWNKITYHFQNPELKKDVGVFGSLFEFSKTGAYDTIYLNYYDDNNKTVLWSVGDATDIPTAQIETQAEAEREWREKFTIDPNGVIKEKQEY